MRIKRDVYVSSHNSYFFLLIIYILYLHCSCNVKHHFFLSYHLYHHHHHHFHFIFINTTSHWGRIQQMNSSSMVYPYPLNTLGNHFLLFLFLFLVKSFFGNHHWGVDTIFYIYVTLFNYDGKEARDTELSCRCYLSNSHIVFSV